MEDAGAVGRRGREVVADARSSSSVSSPPTSPPHNDTIHVARPLFFNPGISGGGVANAASATSALPPNASTTTHVTNGTTHMQPSPAAATTTATADGATAPKVKRPRKKKEIGPDGLPVVEDKPKKATVPRKRATKDTTTAGTNGDKPATSRKKIKTEEKPSPVDASAQPRQPTITEMYHHPQSTSLSHPTPLPPTMQQRAPDSFPPSSLPQSLQTSSAPTPRPFSSGQNYDPIRGSTKESVPPRPSTTSIGTPSAQESPHYNRASASPAISSLIDPPVASKPQTTLQQPFVSPQNSTPPHKPASIFAPPPQPQPSPLGSNKRPVSAMDGVMDVEPTCDAPTVDLPKIVKKAPSKSSSSAPTPKAARPTPPPAPRGTGSGLLSTADLFGGPSETTERKGVNIDIDIPLNPAGGNTINIAQEIAKKYGRDAINPRAAAHRAQLLRVAMAANTFADSNDDMSVDLMSEMEGDSNVEMGGMDMDEKSNTGLDTESKPKKTRRKKVEEYDKEDDFIDDTEMAWQEAAAVAKDGFFVYSGPLIPEGQEVAIESAAPTRGRGSRGRGRGGRAAAAGTTHASLADKNRDPTTTRGKPRAPRGTAAPRKPRITKADKEKMEVEKLQRERAVGGMGGPATTTSTTLPGQSTMQMQLPTQAVPQQQSSTYTQPMGSMA